MTDLLDYDAENVSRCTKGYSENNGHKRSSMSKKLVPKLKHNRAELKVL